MRIPLGCLFVVLLGFCTPELCRASVITFEITDGGELAVRFGLFPFELSADFESRDLDLSGSVNFVSGPLLARVVDEDAGVTSYRYGAGVLHLQGSGFTDNGTFVQGGFTVATSPFWVDVFEEADDLFGGGLADDFYIDLGVGLFDPALARLLKVRRKTTGGDMLLGLEDIDGGPESSRRDGFDHRGYTDLDIVAEPVPEPGLVALALVG
jgi:hypothetical protein